MQVLTAKVMAVNPNSTNTTTTNNKDNDSNDYDNNDDNNDDNNNQPLVKHNKTIKAWSVSIFPGM